MAGDWIKMRMDLQTHPKIVRIMSATGSDKFRVIGGLHAVWCIFDQHSDNGKLQGYSPEMMDSVIGWTGLADALIAVGWLSFDAETLVMPEFDSHNGKSAKRRADDTKRKRESRICPQDVRKVSADESEKSVTREEKRREDKIHNANPEGSAPVTEIMELFNKSFPELPQVTKISEKRRQLVKRRWIENKDMQTLEDWERFFNYIGKSDFLMGRTPKPWHGLCFDWIFNSTNFIKITEGNYHA